MFSLQPKHCRAVRRRLSVVLIGSVSAFASVTCSDDKSEQPPGASQSAGGESTAERVKRRANEVHGDFKDEVKPAAQWVDEKSRRVVDEVKTAVHKADDALRDDDESAAATASSKPAPVPAPAGAGTAPTAAKPAEPPASSKPAPVPAPATPK